MEGLEWLVGRFICENVFGQCLRKPTGFLNTPGHLPQSSSGGDSRRLGEGSVFPCLMASVPEPGAETVCTRSTRTQRHWGEPWFNLLIALEIITGG